MMFKRCWLVVAFLAFTIVLRAAEGSAPVYEWYEVDLCPQVKSADMPKFPKKGVSWKETGDATVDYVVTEAGDVDEVRVLNASRPPFGETSAETIAKWKFKPAQKDGRPVRVRMLALLFFQTSRGQLEVPFSAYEPYVGEIAKQPTQLATVRYRIGPNYPPDLGNQGIGGQVMIECVVTEKGEAKNVKVIRADQPMLGLAAATGILRTKYNPGRVNSRNVATQVAVQVDFDAAKGISVILLNPSS